jgi:penicillin-binding protein 1C
MARMPRPYRSGGRLVHAALVCGLVGLVLLGLSLGAAGVQRLAQMPEINLDLSAGRSPIVLDRDGRLLRAFTMEDGRWRLPLGADDVDPRYLAFLKAFEDQRFEHHAGVDPLALLRAAGQMIRAAEVVSGGSTLTMQVARLAEPRPDRTLTAKLRQMLQAWRLERRLGKDEILGLYLSLAPFGGNIEGVRAASFAYFGREPKRLSLGEAALLVALPQSPETRRPDRFPDAARRARDRVIDRALAHRLLSPAEAEAAKAEPIPTHRRPFPMIAAHAAEWARADRPAERIQRLTIDARLQVQLEQLARERAAALGPKLSAAIVVVDNATGEIRASVAGAEYLSGDRAGALDLTKAVRSPGSALKPLIYALAFENGIAHPETMLEDRPTRYSSYAPDNFDMTFQGVVTARRALQLSLNVPTVELLSLLGPTRFRTRLRGMGVDLVLPRESGAPGLAIGLGGVGITLNDLTRLYLALARGGEAPPLTLREGDTNAETRYLADPVASWYVADVLLGAPPPLNAPANRLAYKTGTSYGYRDAWAIGFDRRHTIGVWLGRADNAAVPGLVGRTAAAPMLFDAFARVGIDPGGFARPADSIVARTSDLPPPLRHLRQDVAKTVAAIAQAPLRVAFPPNGAKIDLLATQEEGRPVVKLQAGGGQPPFIWLVNGAPIGGASHRRTQTWRPDGAGFADIAVIDASGATESISIRLQR